MNKTVEALHKDLRFQIHEQSERLMVEVIDVVKTKLLRKFLPALLDMLGRIRDGRPDHR